MYDGGEGGIKRKKKREKEKGKRKKEKGKRKKEKENKQFHNEVVRVVIFEDLKQLKNMRMVEFFHNLHFTDQQLNIFSLRKKKVKKKSKKK